MDAHDLFLGFGTGQLGFEFLALAGIFSNEPLPLFFPFDHAFFGHGGVFVLDNGEFGILYPIKERFAAATVDPCGVFLCPYICTTHYLAALNLFPPCTQSG